MITLGIIAFALLIIADFVFSLVSFWQDKNNPRRHGLIEPVLPQLPWRPVTSIVINKVIEYKKPRDLNHD